MIDINATLIAQILNFLILAGLLRAVAYKPVVRMLKARQDRIQESLDKADADAEEADKLLAEYQAKLAKRREGYSNKEFPYVWITNLQNNNIYPAGIALVDVTL